MSYLNFSNNLYLGRLEYLRLNDFFDKEGLKKYIQNTLTSFGLIDDSKGIVTESTISSNGLKTIKINSLLALDSDGKFISNSIKNNDIEIPSDSRWYWLIVYHSYSHIEKGVWSIDNNGNLSGTNGELLKIFRQIGNFPTRIRFTSSVNNVWEYDVLSVINDNQAVLQGSFVSEDNLTIEIVGTFTPGVIIPNEDKQPFYFDFFSYSLTPETQLNTPPSIISGKQFSLARIKSDGLQLTIQDKRSDFIKIKDSVDKDISNLVNSFIGPEYVKYPSIYSVGDKNILRVGLGINCDNWNVNSNSKQLVINSCYGGIIKNINNITNTNLFVGWRVYTKSGNFYTIQSTRSQGNSISFVLNKLDINEFSSDGGSTFLNYSLKILPPYEQIDLRITPTQNFTGFQSFIKSINNGITYCEIELPFFNNESSCSYVLEYRMKYFNNYTSWLLPNDDNENGYLDETSFDNSGNLRTLENQTRKTYTCSNTIGYIEITKGENSFSSFKQRVDKDKQCTKQANFPNLLNIISLYPGQDCFYQIFSGSIFIKNFSELYIDLKSLNGIEGNKFILHLKDDLIAFESSTRIFIVQDLVNPGDYKNLLKEITIQDIYTAKNSDNGVQFTCTFDGNNWNFSQTYTNPKRFEITMYHGSDITKDFDLNSGIGKTKGWFGHALCDGRNNTPDLSERLPIGYGNNYLNLGDKKGNSTSTLKLENMPKHIHKISTLGGKQSFASTKRGVIIVEDYDTTYVPSESDYEVRDIRKSFPEGGEIGGEIGTCKPFDIIPPSTVVAFVKQLY